MKKHLLASTALSLFVGGAMWAAPAQAADLPSRKYAPAPVNVAPVLYDWTGPYVGLQAGYAWGRSDATLSENGVTTLNQGTSASGALGGLFLGYNFMFPNRVVIGVEADINYVDFDTKNHLWLADPVAYTSFRSRWGGSLRLRAGYAFDRVLVYVTGGVALADGRHEIDGFSASNTHVGWTLGGGVAYAFTDQLTGRVEVRYTDFDKRNYVTPLGITRAGFHYTSATVGLSYKF